MESPLLWTCDPTMRHTITIKEMPPERSWAKTTQRVHSVGFEYAVPQPVDQLAEAVIRAFVDENVKELTVALKAFTDAGYNPSFIQMVGSIDYEQYSSLQNSPPRSLLMVALAGKKPRTTLMKPLVLAGCDPFTPFNFAASAISDENGPSSKGRKQWAWLLDNTEPARWLEASVNEAGHSVPEVSLLHLAIRLNKRPVVEAMVKRLGLDVLKAEGPPIFEWIDRFLPGNASLAHKESRQAMIEALREPLITLEREQLNQLAQETAAGAKPGGRARL